MENITLKFTIIEESKTTLYDAIDYVKESMTGYVTIYVIPENDNKYDIVVEATPRLAALACYSIGSHLTIRRLNNRSGL